MSKQSLKLLPKRGSTTAKRSGMKAFFDRRIAYLLLATAGASFATASVSAEEISGYWLTKTGGDIVEVGPCGTSAKRMCGKIVWSAEASGRVVGTNVLKGFRAIGKKSGGRWGKGKVMQDNGKKRAGKLRASDAGLKVSSCKSSSCKSVTWTRPSASLAQEAGLVLAASE